MRYRVVATYRGVPYEAGIGPAGTDVVLFAVCPPPEELGFEPAAGHWRKRVVRAEVDALWESRPVGVYRGGPCMVLDDLGDRLHIAYLGMDTERATALGYWQIDRGVFEVLAAREEVTGLTEERVEKPLRWSGPGTPAVPAPGPMVTAPPPPPQPAPPYPPQPVLTAEGWPELAGPPPAFGAPSLLAEAGPQLAGAPAGGLPGQPEGRSAGRQRVSTRAVFCELADLAAISRHAYALEDEVDGAMCLMQAPGGWEVFVAADGARHEVRAFADEEAAYFYLFGVLAAEAIRNGGLAPR